MDKMGKFIMGADVKNISDPAKRGSFIVIYGANNLGKTTQAKALVEKLKQIGIDATLIKYPIYDLAPTGPELNEILRKGKELPPEREMQKLFVQNRKDFEPTLREMLEKGTWVVAEDYKGTGIAWGMVRGLGVEELEKLNEGLLDEDLSILLYGERFNEGVEKGHINEDNEQVWQKGQEKHLELGKRYGWERVNANGSKQEIAQKIWEIVNRKFN